MALTLVQSASNKASASSGVTVTLGSNTTAGNCLMVCVASINTGGTGPSVSSVEIGASADHFARAKAQLSGGSNFVNSEGWTDQNCVGGQTAVAVSTSSAATELMAVAMEWSSIISTGAVDVALGTGSTGGTTWTTGSSGTLAQPTEVVIGMVGVYAGTGVTIGTPTSPWTELAQVSGGSGVEYVLAVGYQVVAATTALTYNGTASGSGTAGSSSVIISLKGLAPPPPALRPVNINQSVMRAAIW